MRNIILFMIFLIISFFVNVLFYYVSEDYRFFLKNIKTDEKIVTNSDYEITDDLENIEENNFNQNDNIISLENEKNIKVTEIKLGKNYDDIISLFNLYDLKQLEINTNLFDITDEYPDKYLEFYSPTLTIYFFTTKSYQELYDIFDILSTELPFSIKELNNFGSKSFYINLNQEIDDNFVRLIISHKGISFGLKIKKNEYNLVKEKLNTLRNNN